MAFDTFHPFSRLPYELRHLIWNAAIRPNDSNTFAMHSIATIKSCTKRNCPVVLPQLLNTNQMHYVVAIPESTGSKISNRSAYLWDAGLWTTCWESYKVMASTLEMRSDGEIRRSPSFECNLTPQSEKPVEGATYRSHGSRPIIVPALPSRNEPERRSLYSVRPRQDGFKLSPTALLDWTRQFRLQSNWVENFYNYPSRPKNSLRPVKHLVVEFDSRWTRDRPESLAALLRETSPRGCIATILAASDCYEVDLFVWLIDRGNFESQKPRVPKQKEAQPYVFYDCYEEYVEIEMTSRSKIKKHDRDSAMYFLQILDILACEASDGCDWGAGDLGEDYGPGMFGNVGLLQPKKARDEEDVSDSSCGRDTLEE